MDSSMWDTLLVSFVIVVALGVMYFLGDLVKKLVHSLRRRRSQDVELATISSELRPSPTTRRPFMGRNADVIRSTVASECENTNRMRQSSTRISRRDVPNRYRNYSYSDTFKSAFVQPRSHDDAPPSYESVMESAMRDVPPPSYSSVQGTLNVPSALSPEENEHLLESEMPTIGLPGRNTDNIHIVHR